MKKAQKTNKKTETTFKTEKLIDWVLDISETEREKQETAKKISDTLQDIIDEQNKKAT